jgi:trehalose 6-phosphate synthase
MPLEKEVTRMSRLGLRSRPDSLVVLANRAPFTHKFDADGRAHVHRTASGLVTALEPLLEKTAGTWVAHGDADDLRAADRQGRLTAVSNGSQYRLRYVGSDRPEYDGYYNGFANQALWPLCHATDVSPTFDAHHFRCYERANRRFARAVCDEASGAAPLVLVQDYHFALAPGMIRRSLPAATIVSFWHIPWPDRSRFESCPWHRTLMDGLLGSDIVGVQTEDDCVRFLEGAAETPGCDVDFARQRIEHRGRWVRVRAYPVGVRWNPPVLRTLASTDECRRAVIAEFGLPEDVRIGVGVDRLDYTKGIIERFQAVERMLEQHPELIGRFTLVQIAAPSRSSLDEYQNFDARVRALVLRINKRFSSGGYEPIVFKPEHHDSEQINRYYRAADVCVVTSLHDGMNLVAKEFIAARNDERGVLVLSQFTGAARELHEALIVNPYHIEQSAEAMYRALTMPDAEQRERMRGLRSRVRDYNVYRWAGHMLLDASRLRQRERIMSKIHSHSRKPLRRVV